MFLVGRLLKKINFKSIGFSKIGEFVGPCPSLVTICDKKNLHSPNIMNAGPISR
jgi:hypothetical protein